MGKSDVVLKMEFSTFGKINLEMNGKFYKEIIVRNLEYIAKGFSSFLKSNNSCSDMKPIIQIKFNKFDIDKNNKNILDLYTLRNSNNRKLINMLQKI